MHKHKWRLTSTSRYNTPPGTIQIFRKCKCGEIKKDILEPSEGLVGVDIPIIVKSLCIFHRWKTMRDYLYCLDTDVGKIHVNGRLQKCSKCSNIKIKIE